MNFEYPLALLAALSLGAIVWAHLRGRATDARPLSAFFLLKTDGEESEHGGRRLSAWPLFLMRSLAVVILILTVAGPSCERSQGTLVLAGGAGTVSSEWDSPITIIRAGYPPEQHEDLAALAHVDGPPNWTAALALGRSLAPGAQVVRVPGRADQRPMVAAGAALVGREVAVSVTSATRPVVSVGDATLKLRNRGGEWFFRGPVKAGGATVAIDGEVVSSFCIPDTRPLRVLRGAWPTLVTDVLEVIPYVEFVEKGPADWRLGRGKTTHLWSPFRPGVTLFDWNRSPDRGIAPVWFEGALPIPDAVLRRWRALQEPRSPVLWADGVVVADVGDGSQGRVRRFGFLPSDTDLPMTAAWPALFLDAVEQDRAERNRCREVRAGETLVLSSDGPLTVIGPTGEARRVDSRGGRVAIDRLDTAGLYTLKHDGETAFIAVKPSPRDKAETIVESPVKRIEEANRMTWAWGAAAAILGVMIVGHLWRSVALWIALLILVLAGLDPSLLGVDRGAVVLAVDVSGSMPVEETRQVVDRLEQSLGEHLKARVEGADVARRISEPGEPLGDFGGPTRFGPLLSTAAEVAGDDGVVVLVSDGWPRDGVVSVNRPVFTISARADRVDAAITGARAVRLGEKIFVRVMVRSDRPSKGVLQIGALNTPVDLAGTGEQTIQAVLTAVNSETIDAVITVPRDRVLANNRRPIVVEGQGESLAVVVGPAEAWARNAGFEVRTLSVSELGEFGGELSQARALWIADQPAERFESHLVERLERWVRSGGFLVLSGRESAFGSGGWTGTPLESLSPIISSPARPTKRRAGIVLLVDRSGSIAKEAGGVGLESTAQLVSAIAGGLLPQDEVSVVAFGGDVQTLLPPTKVEALVNDSIPVPTVARGGTRLGPAIERAEQLLKASGVEERVIVILSDGRFADADSIVAQRKKPLESGAKVVALIGGDDPKNEPLASLVEATGGSIRHLGNQSINIAIERVFSALSGELLVSGGEVIPGPGWQSRVGQTAPPIRARIRVRARAKARVLASVSAEPILGEWRLGRGRVLAIATDDWGLSSEQWAALMAPALLPRAGGPTVTVEGDSLFFQGATGDPSPRSEIEFTLPGGKVETARWIPVGPGRSRAPLPSGPSMALNVSSTTAAGSVDLRVVSNHDRELSSRPPNRQMLTLQSALNGAQLLDSPTNMDAVLKSRGHRGRWQLAVLGAMLACLLVLLDALLWAGWRRAPFG